MRKSSAARDPDGAEFLLHAVRQAQGTRYQRAQRQRPKDRRRIQGVAWTGLRLLLDQAFTPCQAVQERREKLSDRASVDDQPLMPDLEGKVARDTELFRI